MTGGRAPGAGPPVCSTWPTLPLPAKDTQAPPRLLPMWDSTLLAPRRRRAAHPPEVPAFWSCGATATCCLALLVDGQVVGV